MRTFAEIVPSVYAIVDQPDGSFAAFVSSYDGTHDELETAIESIASCATANKCPDAFIPYVADKFGNPFSFMSTPRWQRGDKLDQLTTIYANRGSKAGLVDTIQFLCGVPAVIQLDIEYCWTLGISTLGGFTTP